MEEESSWQNCGWLGSRRMLAAAPTVDPVCPPTHVRVVSPADSRCVDVVFIIVPLVDRVPPAERVTLEPSSSGSDAGSVAAIV